MHIVTTDVHEAASVIANAIKAGKTVTVPTVKDNILTVREVDILSENPSRYVFAATLTLVGTQPGIRQNRIGESVEYFKAGDRIIIDIDECPFIPFNWYARLA